MKNGTQNLKGENTEKRLSSLEKKIKKIDLKQINDDFRLNLSKNNYSINEVKETKYTSENDEINYFKKLSSKNIGGQELVTENPDFAISAFSKTIFTSGRGHVIKSKFLLLVSILFMSFSVLMIKILFLSHQQYEQNEQNQQNQQKHNLSHNTINFFCGFYMFIFSILFIKIDNINLSLKKNFNKLEIDSLLIRSLSGFLAIHFTIRALDSMRLVSATTLIYLSPVISTFMLMIHKQEKVKFNDKLCLIGSLCIIIIFVAQKIYFEAKKESNVEDNLDLDLDLSDTEFKDSFTGIIFCLIASCLNSINSVMDKKVCYEFHSYVILFTTGTIAIILTPIFMSISQDQLFINPINFLLFFVLGCCIFLGSYYTHKTIEANCLLVNSLLHIITILMAYFYAYVIFDEPVTIYDLLSGILIIMVNFYMKLRAEECEEIDNSDNF